MNGVCPLTILPTEVRQTAHIVGSDRQSCRIHQSCGNENEQIRFSQALSEYPQVFIESLKALISSGVNVGAFHCRWFFVNMAKAEAPMSLALSGALNKPPEALT